MLKHQERDGQDPSQPVALHCDPSSVHLVESKDDPPANDHDGLHLDADL